MKIENCCWGSERVSIESLLEECFFKEEEIYIYIFFWLRGKYLDKDNEIKKGKIIV